MGEGKILLRLKRSNLLEKKLKEKGK